MRKVLQRFWCLRAVLLVMLILACNSGQSGKAKVENLPKINKPPEITSSPIRVGVVASPYLYAVKATDPNGDVLTYGQVNLPKGMAIDSVTGKITWTPEASQIGNQIVEITVTDDKFTNTQKFAIRVIPTDNGVPFQPGCSITSYWHNDYQQYAAKLSVDRMKASGCTVISVLVTQYQAELNSTEIESVGNKTPYDSALIEIIRYIHKLGLKVMLKPHVDVLTEQWRGDITHTNNSAWNAWFNSYTLFITHYLELAQANKVEIFCIGTELKGTEHRAKEWRAQIANARTKFSGLLTYAANWDSYARITWWDALDFIGIDAYFPLTGSLNPSPAALKARWVSIKNKLAAFAKSQGKDIVFTEIGYQSLNGANITPNWVSGDNVDLQEQADCYQAFLSVMYDQPWFKGFYNWMWYWDLSQDPNYFNVFEKPAEKVLRSYFLGN